MGRPGVMFYFNYRSAFKWLTLEEKGLVYEAMVDYGQYGTVPDFDDVKLAVLWDMLQPQLDADQRSYEKKVARSRAAAESRWSGNAKHADASQAFPSNAKNADAFHSNAKNADAFQAWEKENETENENENEIENEYEYETEKETEKRRLPAFLPPTVNQVNEYCIMNNLRVLGQKFVDYYEERGWMSGKRPMTDWRAVVRVWSERERDTPGVYEDPAEYAQKLLARQGKSLPVWNETA